MQSKLIFANDHYLSLREILAITPLHLRLVVLSACETMQIGMAIPDEVVSLPTGFIQAGSCGVIGSLWAADDAATQTLMTYFYDLLLLKDLPPAKALHQAQALLRESQRIKRSSQIRLSETDYSDMLEDLIAGDKSYQHPYYWAAFAYTGV